MVATVRIAAAAQVDLWCSLGGFSTWFFERTRVCPGPKRQLDRFSHFCNADVRDQRGYSARNVKKCFLEIARIQRYVRAMRSSNVDD